MILNFPTIRQGETYDCGPACARAVLSYFRVKRPAAALIAELGTTPADGTDPRMLEVIFRRAGLRVQSGEMTLADLRHHTEYGRPVVCLVTPGAVGHYVVAVRVTLKGRVHVMDPAAGPTIHLPAEFVSRWHDRCRIGAEFRNWALAVWRQD